MERTISTRESRGCRMILLTLATACLVGEARAELVYGITQQQFLVSWDSGTPGTIQTGIAVQGLQPNEQVMGIDFRPSTSELYALGSFSRLYKIDPATGKATEVGSGPFSPLLNGSSFGFDFNPTVDRIRVVSNADQNLRLHPDTGLVVSVDGDLEYAVGDVNFGKNPNVNSAGYTNSFPGATSTTLYVVDTGLDVLATQIPPNDGVLNTIGALGTDITDLGGFDISGVTGTAYMAAQQSSLSKSTFWTIDLATGQATLVGEIGGGTIITAMAVVPEASGVMLIAVGLAGLVVRRLM